MRLELKTDSKRMWDLELKSTYRSTNYAALAVRETFQNSVDAYRKSKMRGPYYANYANGILTIGDLAGGMDPKTLQEKFLTLGTSGKSEDEESVGGFGVAKAVILGCGEKWVITSQDYTVDSESFQVAVTDKLMAGFKIDIQTKMSTSDMSDWLMFIGLSDPSVKPQLQGFLNSYVDLGRGRNVDISGLDWGDCRTKITKYRSQEIAFNTSNGNVKVDLRARGLMVVRLGGLVQFFENLYELPGTILVIDMKPKCRPGTSRYPFNKGRDGFRGPAVDAWYKLNNYLKQEAISARESDEWVHVDFDFMDDAQDDCDSDIESKDSESPDITTKLEEVEHIIRQRAHPDLGEDQDRNLVRQMERAYGEGVCSDRQRFNEALTKYMAAFKNSIKVHAKDSSIKKQPCKSNPLPFKWTIRRARGYKARFDIAKTANQRLLSYWRELMQLISVELELPGDLRPGIVLSQSKEAMCLAQNGKFCIMLNPVTFREYHNPLNIEASALRTWQVMCHELAHTLESGHGQTYSCIRESYSDKTTHLFNDIFQLARKYLSPNLDEKEDAVRDLERLGWDPEKAKYFVEKTSPARLKMAIKRLKKVL
ncbi:MAG: hypothetical protein HQL31_04030 [Planctomycetes bacterium]|nr:hypothetical protein [Planctomycetota bacterium]